MDPEMKMAIISNGPTAEDYARDGRRFDVVAGCRAQASKYLCDWWVVADAKGYEIGPRPKGSPCVFTRANVPLKLQQRAEASRHNNTSPAETEDEKLWKRFQQDDTFFVEECVDPPAGMGEHVARRWFVWSGPMALNLARFLKPAELTIYGMGMAGLGDAQGVEDTTNRGPHRWGDERDLCASLINDLTMSGTFVERIVGRRRWVHEPKGGAVASGT